MLGKHGSRPCGQRSGFAGQRPYTGLFIQRDAMNDLAEISDDGLAVWSLFVAIPAFNVAVDSGSFERVVGVFDIAGVVVVLG